MTHANPSNSVLHPLSVVAIHLLSAALYVAGAQKTFAFQNGTNLTVREKGIYNIVLSKLEGGLIDLEYI